VGRFRHPDRDSEPDERPRLTREARERAIKERLARQVGQDERAQARE